MNWNVTYRNKDGHRVTDVFEADSRNALFKILSSKGISVIRIEEVRGKIKQPDSLRKTLRIVLPLLVCFSIVSFIYLKLVKSDSASGVLSSEKISHRIKNIPNKKNVGPRVQVTNRVISASQVKAVVDHKPTLHERLAKRKFGVGNTVHTTRVDRVKSEYEIFKHRSENHLAFLANVPLGTSVIGNKKYTPRFMDDLRKALEEDIVISPDDTEQIRGIKQSVIEVKRELKRLIANGEDIPKILTETFNEIQKMGTIKKDLEKEIRKANRDSTMTDDDMELLVKAANQMLEEKGISPINYNPLTRKILRGRFSTKEGIKE